MTERAGIGVWWRDEGHRSVAVLYQLHEGAADAKRAGCDDCGHLFGVVSWWCGSEDARKHFGTTQPERQGCPFWKAPPVSSFPKLVPTAPRSWWDRFLSWFRRAS